MQTCYTIIMAKEPPTPQAPQPAMPSFTVVCAHCAQKVHALQEGICLIFYEGKRAHRFYPTDIICIRVKDNDCDIRYLDKYMRTIDRNCIRSSLKTWEELLPFGLVRISQQLIVNLKYINKVSGHELYCQYLKEPMEVTQSYERTVCHALKELLQLHHSFGRSTPNNEGSAP